MHCAAHRIPLALPSASHTVTEAVSSTSSHPSHCHVTSHPWSSTALRHHHLPCSCEGVVVTDTPAAHVVLPTLLSLLPLPAAAPVQAASRTCINTARISKLPALRIPCSDAAGTSALSSTKLSPMNGTKLAAMSASRMNTKHVLKMPPTAVFSANRGRCSSRTAATSDSSTPCRWLLRVAAAALPSLLLSLLLM